MDSAKVRVKMPKFTYDFAIDNMKPILEKLGMGIAFTKWADFSKMYHPTEAKVSITKAIHKTYIRVNEEGTEAAAVTGIGMGTTSISPSINFTLDHPFIYLIAEKQTGAILFLGSVNNPSSSDQ